MGGNETPRAEEAPRLPNSEHSRKRFHNIAAILRTDPQFAVSPVGPPDQNDQTFQIKNLDTPYADPTLVLFDYVNEKIIFTNAAGEDVLIQIPGNTNDEIAAKSKYPPAEQVVLWGSPYKGPLLLNRLLPTLI